MMASSCRYDGEPAEDFCHAIDIDSPAADLAREAFYIAPLNADAPREPHVRELWAEAEALLRDGWSPGEELVRL